MTLAALETTKRVAGDTLELEWIVTDQDNAFADITGFDAEFALRKDGEDANTLESPADATVTITDAGGGKLEVKVEGAKTAPLLGRFTGHLRLTDPAGDIHTVGRISVEFIESLHE